MKKKKYSVFLATSSVKGKEIKCQYLFSFRGKLLKDRLTMTFSMSELNRTTKLLIETDEEDPDAAPQKSAKEIEEEKKAEKDAQQKMVNTNKNTNTNTNTNAHRQIHKRAPRR